MRLRDNHESCHGSHPGHPDGGEWTHVMVLHDGSTVYADSAAEVLAEMLPGYEGLDDAAQRDLRVRHARLVAEFVQRLYVQQATEAGVFDAADPQQAPLATILDTDKGLSLGLELPDAPGEPADWLPPVPLVLLSTSYAPHTEYPAIGGNVVWIDPTTEGGYLDSLAGTGAFDYWRASESGLAGG